MLVRYNWQNCKIFLVYITVCYMCTLRKHSPIELTHLSPHIFTFFFFLVRIFTFHSLSKFPLNNTVLSTIVTMFYIRSSELIHFVTENLYRFTYLSLFPPIIQPLAITFLFVSEFNVYFLDSTCKWYHAVFVFFCLA